MYLLTVGVGVVTGTGAVVGSSTGTKIYIYTYLNSETLVEKIFESAQHFRSGNYYTINVVPGFRSEYYTFFR